MRYHVLATDFDGTLAEDGVVPPETIAALERCHESGRYLLMVTGRELTELKVVFPRLDLFEYVVVENGATLYCPRTDVEQALADPPAKEFVRALQSRHVTPLSVGKVIVATRTPHENDVLEVIRDLGLEMQVIFNKGAVMVLPSGVNKATGLKAALLLLKISAHNVVAVGDGENDHALLTLAELGVAVANSVPMLAERADWVTKQPRGAGVVELIENLLKTDFRGLEPKLRRHDLPLGYSAGEVAVNVPPYEVKAGMFGVMDKESWREIAVFAGSVAKQGYQLCVVTPEADQLELFKTAMAQSAAITGKVSDGLSLLKEMKSQLIFCTADLSAADQSKAVGELLQGMTDLRKRFGRPHWILACHPEKLLADVGEWKNLLEQHSSIMIATVQSLGDLPAEAQQVWDQCVFFNTAASEAFQQGTSLKHMDQSIRSHELGNGKAHRTFWSRGANDLFAIQMLNNDPVAAAGRT